MSRPGSFISRQLRVTLTLNGEGAVFPGTNSNQLVLTNLRVAARFQSVYRLSTTCTLSIFGMKQSDMDAMTVVFANPPIVTNASVVVEVLAGNNWLRIFSGQIYEAQPTYRTVPDVAMQISAFTGYLQKITLVPGTSYDGDVDIMTIVRDLAGRMGLAVAGEATGSLHSPSLEGSLYDQLVSACTAANVDFYFLGDTLLVTPFGKPRDQQPSIVLSPSTGLIGYPSYEAAGLSVQCLFDPAILCGTPIEIRDSIVPKANGRWYPVQCDHQLDCNVPDGQWQSSLFCTRILSEAGA